MSESVSIDVRVLDTLAFTKAAKSLDFVESHSTTEQKVNLFSTSHTGMHVKFKNWNYPVVFENGKAVYDNYNGKWGDIKKLNEFVREYTAFAAINAAAKEGTRVTSNTLVNDKRVLTMTKRNGKQVRLTCTNEGAHAEVIGCTGRQCEGVLDSVKDLGDVKSRKLKPEYYEQEERERLREGDV
jgi:hypothetical protein